MEFLTNAINFFGFLMICALIGTIISFALYYPPANKILNKLKLGDQFRFAVVCTLLVASYFAGIGQIHVIYW